MRIGPAFVVAGLFVLTSCAPSTDVEVAQSSASEVLPPVANTDPAGTTSTTTTPPAEPGSRSPQLLVASDLPGWDVSGPMSVPEEPTWTATDCPDMNVAWATAGMSGTRSRGKNGTTSFRNTAVDLGSAEAAAAVLDAVDRVWTDCVVFESDLGTFWSEPVAMPQSEHPSAGIVIGNQALTTALAYWQVDTTVVILEIEGEDMWALLDPLLATMAARLDGNPRPLDSTERPTVTIDSTLAQSTPGPTTTPGERPDNEDPATIPEIVPVTLPPLPPISLPQEPEQNPDAFPPTDSAWVNHDLARFALSPDEIGAGWEFSYGDTTEAAPSDPADDIDGCDVEPPPTLNGIELRYSNQLQEVSITVGEGSREDAQAFIAAFRGITECDLSDADLGITDYVEIDVTLPGASDSIFISSAADDEELEGFGVILGLARYDGLLIAAFSFSSEGDEVTPERIGELIDMMHAKN